MAKKILLIIAILLALLIGTMPFLVLIQGAKFGIEETKDLSLYKNLFWKINFYIHVTFGGIPLLIGWILFNTTLRTKYLNAHRLIGKVYVSTFLITALAGFCIAFYATGGLIPALGFGAIAIISFYSTLKAYLSIREGDIIGHQKMMVYSYAACFAAVTFRLSQTFLMLLLNDPDIAYKIASWVGWLPNILVAYWITQQKTDPIRGIPS